MQRREFFLSIGGVVCTFTAPAIRGGIGPVVVVNVV
jgi:hypothetical protein